MLIAGTKITRDNCDYIYWIENGVVYCSDLNCQNKRKAYAGVNSFGTKEWFEYDQSIKLTEANKRKAYQEKDNSNFVYGYCVGLDRWIGYNIDLGNYFAPACPENISVIPKGS